MKGYIKLFGRYVSLNLIFKLFLAFTAMAMLYLLLFHGKLMAFYYESRHMAEFRLDSPYLAAYTGKARLLQNDGSLLYEGDVAAAAADGRGTLYSGGSIVYEGEFAGSEYSGRGKEYLNGRLVYEGDFEKSLYNGNGVFYGENEMYSGMFENGKYHGGGSLIFSKDNKEYTYKGMFFEGMMQGSGKLFCDKKLMYEGEFSEGLYHGYGKLYENDDCVYKGMFSMGLYDGEGSAFIRGALVYKGEFYAGLYNGEGTEYSTNTGYKIYEGKYLNGYRMEAGTEFGKDGEAIKKAPESMDYLSLLGTPYKEAVAILQKQGKACELQALIGGYFPMLADNEVICAFTVAEESNEPEYLEKIYLSGPLAAGDIIVGSDIRLIEEKAQKSVLAGSVRGKLEELALIASNSCWGREISLLDIACKTFSHGDVLISAYYIPLFEELILSGEGAAEAMPEEGTILFVKIEYRSGYNHADK